MQSLENKIDELRGRFNYQRDTKNCNSWLVIRCTSRIEQRRLESPFESCLRKVEKLLFQKVKKAEEAKDFEFYAFSYYYDRAVDLGALDEKTGGTIKVSDYIDAAKSVCNGMTVIPRENPFLCLDLTYISRMLQGLGFPKEKVFKLARKIDEVETSWALGASFHYIESLHSQ